VQWVEAPSAQREELIKQGKVDLVIATYTINEAYSRVAPEVERDNG
jgi:glutamate transport system substrate-binding protein